MTREDPTMRPVVLDITRLLRRHLRGRRATGVDRVGLAYVAHFGQRAEQPATALVRVRARWVFFSPFESRRLFELLLDEPGTDRVGATRLLLLRAMRPRTHRPPAGACLLNVVHSGLERGDLARRLREFALEAMYFVHDLLPITHPHLHRPGEAARHRARMRNAIGTGRALIVNSAATLRSLQDFARAEALRLPPCVVAHLAPAPLAAPSTQPIDRAATQPHFVMLGTIEPRKNHALMLRVWRELVARHGAAAPRLVVIGQPGWLCEDVLAELRRGDPAITHVHYLERCTDAELARQLRGARALLFPSHAEGYGLPLVEALAAGVPVIASDLPVFREIAASVPTFVDGRDAAAWLAAVLAYARADSPARTAQMGRLQEFAAPTWSRHFAQVASLQEDVDAVAA